MDETAPTLFLIDISSYIYRAFHAIRGLSTAAGRPTNAVFGVTNMLLKVLRERQPQYLALVFDAKGPTFRHRLYPDYKALRPPMPADLVSQLPEIQQVIAALNLPAVEQPGFEADDLICTLARRARAEGFAVEIVSGDKDLLPLVGDGVTMWDPMKDIRYGPAEVRAKYGLDPEELVEMRGLAGDAVDNIPGVPGIGEKTAIKLIGRFHSVANLLAHLDEVAEKKLRARLTEHADQARLSRELSELRADVPLEVAPGQLRPGPPDRPRLRELFAALEFTKFTKELATAEEACEITVVTGRAALAAVAGEIRAAGQAALFTLAGEQHPALADMVGLGVAWQEGGAAYLPLAGGVSPADLREVLGPLWADPGIVKIGADLKRELLLAARLGLELAGLTGDIQLASYVLNPDRYEQTLENIALSRLGVNLLSPRELAGRPSAAVDLPLELAQEYAGRRAAAAVRLWPRLAQDLERDGLGDLYRHLELPLLPILAGMESRGIRVDTGFLGRFGAELEKELGELEEKIFALAGEAFLINSPQQLGYILFEKLGLPVQKKTRGRTAYSTDNEVLTTLAALHPIAALTIQYRTLAKLKATYVDALLKVLNPATGRVHTTFVQSVAATGRLSSRDPNLQNIPVRGELGGQLRKAFIPADGCVFVSGDYSQIELRLLAHLSEDPVLLTAFREGRDIHRQTAAEVFALHPELVTPEMRRQAKVINFGIIYGMSAFGLAKQLGVGPRLAQDFINRYFTRHAGVKRFFEATLAAARERGWVSTLWGRRRHIPNLASANRTLRQEAERAAMNTPLQGTAADLIKQAMLAVEKEFRQNGISGLMLLQLHDELLFEVNKMEAKIAARMLQKTMESVASLNVPLIVDISVGTDWADMHPGTEIPDE